MSLSVNDVNSLKEIASYAYGSRWYEGTKGGKGHMGILNRDGELRVIKFDTHGSNSGVSSELMSAAMKSSQSLREYLCKMANKAGLLDDAKKNEILATLGESNKSLLTRSAVAKVVKLIDRNIFDSIAQDSNRNLGAYSTRNIADTSLEAVERMDDRDNILFGGKITLDEGEHNNNLQDGEGDLEDNKENLIREDKKDRKGDLKDCKENLIREDKINAREDKIKVSAEEKVRDFWDKINGFKNSSDFYYKYAEVVSLLEENGLIGDDKIPNPPQTSYGGGGIGGSFSCSAFKNFDNPLKFYCGRKLLAELFSNDQDKTKLPEKSLCENFVNKCIKDFNTRVEEAKRQGSKIPREDVIDREIDDWILDRPNQHTLADAWAYTIWPEIRESICDCVVTIFTQNGFKNTEKLIDDLWSMTKKVKRFSAYVIEDRIRANMKREFIFAFHKNFDRLLTADIKTVSKKSIFDQFVSTFRDYQKTRDEISDLIDYNGKLKSGYFKKFELKSGDNCHQIRKTLNVFINDWFILEDIPPFGWHDLPDRLQTIDRDYCAKEQAKIKAEQEAEIRYKKEKEELDFLEFNIAKDVVKNIQDVLKLPVSDNTQYAFQDLLRTCTSFNSSKNSVTGDIKKYRMNLYTEYYNKLMDLVKSLLTKLEGSVNAVIDNFNSSRLFANFSFVANQTDILPINEEIVQDKKEFKDKFSLIAKNIEKLRSDSKNIIAHVLDAVLAKKHSTVYSFDKHVSALNDWAEDSLSEVKSYAEGHITKWVKEIFQPVKGIFLHELKANLNSSESTKNFIDGVYGADGFELMSQLSIKINNMVEDAFTKRKIRKSSDIQEIISRFVGVINSIAQSYALVKHDINKKISSVLNKDSILSKVENLQITPDQRAEFFGKYDKQILELNAAIDQKIKAKFSDVTMRWINSDTVPISSEICASLDQEVSYLCTDTIGSLRRTLYGSLDDFSNASDCADKFFHILDNLGLDNFIKVSNLSDNNDNADKRINTLIGNIAFKLFKVDFDAFNSRRNKSVFDFDNFIPYFNPRMKILHEKPTKDQWNEFKKYVFKEYVSKYIKQARQMFTERVNMAINIYNDSLKNFKIEAYPAFCDKISDMTVSDDNLAALIISSKNNSYRNDLCSYFKRQIPESISKAEGTAALREELSKEIDRVFYLCIGFHYSDFEKLEKSSSGIDEKLKSLTNAQRSFVVFLKWYQQALQQKMGNAETCFDDKYLKSKRNFLKKHIGIFRIIDGIFDDIKVYSHDSNRTLAENCDEIKCLTDMFKQLFDNKVNSETFALRKFALERLDAIYVQKEIPQSNDNWFGLNVVYDSTGGFEYDGDGLANGEKPDLPNFLKGT